jgi:hypothetical protein
MNFVNNLTGTTATDGLYIGVYGSNTYLTNYENMPLLLGTNGTIRMNIASDGDIGIGTMSPTAKVNIYANSGMTYPHLLLQENGTEFARLMFKNSTSTTANWTIAGAPWTTDAGARMYFYYYDGTTGSNVVSITGDGKVGIGSESPTQALHVVGNAYKTVGGTTWATSSDRRLKIISGEYLKGLDDIAALKPVRFYYKKGNPKNLPSDAEQVGFVAQDVQKIFPEAVTEGEDGYLEFNMHNINVAYVNAFKELKAENERLTKENDVFKSQMNEVRKYIDILNSRIENLEKQITLSAQKRE